MPTLPASQRKHSPLGGARVLVVGLGRFGGGTGVTQWLAGQDAQVTVTDQASEASLSESVAAIAGLNVALRLGGHEGIDPLDFDLVVVNPAVRKDRSSLFQQISAAGVPWTTELNLFCERCPAPVIGVTGSFGKSTTCAMLANVLEAAPRTGNSDSQRVFLGGNFGGSLLLSLPEIQANDCVVLEISNAQLEDLPRISWTPRVAAITNLFPHHLDRYGSFQEYIQAKLNIVDPSDTRQMVVVGDLHPDADAALAVRTRNTTDRVVRVPATKAEIPLGVPGSHNQANAACVLTISSVLGLDERGVRETLSQFGGLPHRLETISVVRGVRYINDSKSTAPAATMTAVDAVLGGCHEAARCLIVIVGGQDKHVPFQECADRLVRSSRLVICTGEAASGFAEALRAAGGAEDAPSLHVADDLAAAVRLAQAHAAAGDTVLFSPGAPSFDRYVNFTERGKHFSELVKALSADG